VVSQATAEEYDPDDIDEVPCPRCEGFGTIGIGGTVCKLCRGDTVVSRATAAEFESSGGTR
jgi:RecJ-like exonuclease